MLGGGDGGGGGAIWQGNVSLCVRIRALAFLPFFIFFSSFLFWGVGFLLLQFNRWCVVLLHGAVFGDNRGRSWVNS